MGLKLSPGTPQLNRPKLSWAPGFNKAPLWSFRRFPSSGTSITARRSQDQIDEVLECVRSWPTERQEDAVNMLLAMAKLGTHPYKLSPDERAAIEAALAEAERGDLATDAEVKATFARFRR